MSDPARGQRANTCPLLLSLPRTGPQLLCICSKLACHPQAPGPAAWGALPSLAGRGGGPLCRMEDHDSWPFSQVRPCELTSPARTGHKTTGCKEMSCDYGIGIRRTYRVLEFTVFSHACKESEEPAATVRRKRGACTGRTRQQTGKAVPWVGTP